MSTLRTLFLRLRLILRFGDPRLVQLAASFASLTFGTAVVFGGFRPGQPVFAAFETVPTWATGAVFMAAAVAVWAGTLLDRGRPVRWGTLAMMVAWLYTFVTIPVAGALPEAMGGTGTVYYTAFARYLSPLVVAWWVYARSPGPTDPPRPRPWPTGATLLLSLPMVAFMEAGVLAQVDLPSPVDWGLGAAAFAFLGAVLKVLADRYRAKTDYSTEMARVAAENNVFMWGNAKEEIERLKREMDHLRGQFSAHLNLKETQDHWCRVSCPTYTDRPTTP